MGAAVQGEGQEQLYWHFLQQQDYWKPALPGQAKGAFRKREEVTLNSRCFPRPAYKTAPHEGRAQWEGMAKGGSLKHHCSTGFLNF